MENPIYPNGFSQNNFRRSKCDGRNFIICNCIAFQTFNVTIIIIIIEITSSCSHSPVHCSSFIHPVEKKIYNLMWEYICAIVRNVYSIFSIITLYTALCLCAVKTDKNRVTYALAGAFLLLYTLYTLHDNT